MQADLQYHIKRTDLNENRIDQVERKMLEELERHNTLLERKVKIIKWSIGIIAGLVSISTAVVKYL